MTGDDQLQLPFFVYGTLRPGAANHAWALGGKTTAERPARMRGMVLYQGPGYPYAVAVPDQPDAVIHGDLVWPVPERYREVLASLDRLEGYTVGGQDQHYQRVSARAFPSPAGRAIRAWVYLAPPPLAARLRASGEPIPDGDWPHRQQHGTG